MASTYGFTPDDLIGRLSASEIIQLSDDPDAPTGVRNDAVVLERIESAEEEFHLSAGCYYVVPLVPLPKAIRDNLLDLAAYKLLTRRPGFLAKTAEGADYWIARRLELVKWMQRLADRDALIPGAAELSAPPSAKGGASQNSAPLDYTAESLGGLFQ